MNKKVIVLMLTILIIAGGIFYLENQKVTPLIEKELAPLIEEGEYKLAPELSGISGYINTPEGLTLESLRGKVVLVDFWTYTCINCIRTLPYLTAWDQKYRDKGFVIVGVHTPEFEFEKKYENVVKATKQHTIEYAVVQDNDYLTWRAFRNRYWPRKYLIDAKGRIRYDHIGEGAYAETEQMIQELLSEIGAEKEEMISDTIKAEKPKFLTTPELYAGWNFALSRGQNVGNEEGLQPDQVIDYTLPLKRKDDTIYLEGKWLSTADGLKAEEKNTAFTLKFLASSVNIVTGEGPLEMDVYLDDAYINKEKAGDDVLFDGERAYVKIENARLYNVYKGSYARKELKLVSNSDAFSFNAFTFG